jgi:predicted metal-dependent peptidase
MKNTTNNDQVKSLIQIRKSLARGKAGNLAENKAFMDFLQIQQEMTAEFEKTWDVVKERMEEYGVTKISGDFGYITMAERKTFSGAAAPRFMKKVLDSTKVKAYMELHRGNLPEGVKVSTTRFLQKKIKLA